MANSSGVALSFQIAGVSGSYLKMNETNFLSNWFDIRRLKYSQLFDPGFFDFQVESTSGEVATMVIGFFCEGQAGSRYFFMGGYRESASNTLKLVNSLGYLTH